MIYFTYENCRPQKRKGVMAAYPFPRLNPSDERNYICRRVERFCCQLREIETSLLVLE